MDTIGIDFGSTKCIVSYYSKGLAYSVQIDGNHFVPTVVAIHSRTKRIIVGANAKGLSMIDPEAIIFFDRQDLEVEDKYYTVLGETYSPIQIASFIIKYLVENAQKEIGEEITKAVITVPVNCKDTYRMALGEATKLAGIELLSVIDEATAFGFSYLKKISRTAYYLLYDFGGKSLDVSIIEISEEHINVKAHVNDRNLGGEKFDLAIVEYLNKWIEENGNNTNSHRDSLIVQHKLKAIAEEIKIDLSESNSVDVLYYNIFEGENIEISNFSREDFLSLIRAQIENISNVTRDVLDQTPLTLEDIFRVVCIGGSSNIPAIIREVSRIVKEPFLCEFDMISKGASIYAAKRLIDEPKHFHLNHIDVTPYNFGILLENGDIDIFISRNTPIPISVQKQFTTSHHDIAEIDIIITRNVDQIACFTLKGFKSERHINFTIVIKFTLDENGILYVGAEVKESKTSASIYLSQDQTISFISKNRKPKKNESIYFSLFHPKEALVETWYSMISYIHIESAFNLIEEDVVPFFDIPKGSVRRVSEKINVNLKHGCNVLIKPEAEGVEFNPPFQILRWVEDVHRTEFRFKASSIMLNRPCNGELVAYVGPFEIACIRFSIFFSKKEHLVTINKSDPNNYGLSKAMLYRRIFASYSTLDRSLVDSILRAYDAIGDKIYIDYKSLRSGEDWEEEIKRFIDLADIFQLFWSWNSSKSNYVENEWRYALMKNSNQGLYFIRPVYWEVPKPGIPEELKHINFKHISI